MKQNYMVAVCDILGFSCLVCEHGLDKVVDNAYGWFLKVLHQSLHKRGFPDNVPTLRELDAHHRLGFAWFSDTVLFYTLQDEVDAYRSLCATVAGLLFRTMLDPHTRVRCGISYGEAYVDRTNGLFMGKPFIEAHRLQTAQRWAGGAFADSAVAQLPEAARTGQLYEWFVVPFDVPLKAGTSCLAVDWTKGLHIPPLNLPWSRNSDEPSEEDWRTTRDVCEKWKNTVRFHEAVCAQCRVATSQQDEEYSVNM